MEPSEGEATPRPIRKEATRWELKEANWLNWVEATARPSVAGWSTGRPDSKVEATWRPSGVGLAILRPDLMVEASQRPQSSKEKAIEPDLREATRPDGLEATPRPQSLE